MARTPGAERREQILRAAISLATSKGFAGVTTRDVAAELGVAHGLIHHYVESRDALVAAAFDLAVSEEVAACDAAVASIDDPMEALRYLLTAPPPEHYLLWIDAWSEAPRNPALLASLQRHNRSFEEQFVRIVRVGVERGVFRSTNVRAAVRRLCAYADGLAVHMIVLGTLPLSSFRTECLRFAEHELGVAMGTLVPLPRASGAARRSAPRRRSSRSG